MTTLLELVVFLAPPLRPDADRPCALRLAGAVGTVNPCNVRYPSTAGGPYVLGCVEQHIVYLPWLWELLCRLARIAAGLWGCVGWRSLPELYCWRRELLKLLCLANKLCTKPGR